MLILRPLPPVAADHPDPLLNLYYTSLLARWGRADRVVARRIDRVLAGRGDAARLRLGIERKEWALIEGRVPPERYLTMRVRKGLHRLLNASAFPLAKSPLKNKRLFADRAGEEGLVVPETFHPDRHRLWQWIGTSGAMVVKPNFSSKGAGVRRFRRDGAGWRCNAGVRLDRAAMMRLIDRTAKAGGIVQHAVDTDPSFAAISPGALPTMRVVTMRSETGGTEIVARMLRLGGGAFPVDNFNRGGLAASIDFAGALGPFFRAEDGRLAECTRHPVDGAPLPTAIDAPTRHACDAAAMQAHYRLVPDHAVVGWDIGLGADGAVLIEGNWNPGTDILQLLSGEPASAGRTGALYLRALGQVSEADWARAKPVQRERG